MKKKLKKNFKNKLLIFFFSSIFIFIGIISIDLNNRQNERINWFITKLSKTSTWYDIKYGSELFIDRLKKDIFLFINKNPSKLETYNIIIRAADLRRIENIISKKNISDNLNEEDEIWHPINFQTNKDNFPAKIRIRGDQSIHWMNKKKSWKIKFTQEKLFNNRKSIHLILPKERSMEVALSAKKIARKNGLLVPDSGFVLVNQNKKNMGLYYWSETIDKFFLERNDYPIGEIFTGNDVGLQNDELFDKNNVNFYGLNSAAFKTQINDKPEITSAALSQWKKFLELLKTNDSKIIDNKIENYIDIDKFSTWISILAIYGNTHASQLNNVRWFYDPITGLFEPIINDVFISNKTFEEFELDINNPIVMNILKSKKVLNSRLNTLYKLVNEDNEQILKTFTETYSKISPYIYSGAEGYNYKLKGIGQESPKKLFYTHQNRYEILKSNIDNIKKTLSTNRLFVETFLNLKNNNNYYKIDIINQGISSTNIKKIIFFPSTGNKLTNFDGKISMLLTSTEGYKKIIDPNSIKFTENEWSFEFEELELFSPRHGNYIKDIKNEIKWTLHIIFENGNSKTIYENLPSKIDMVVQNMLTNQNISSNNINKSKIIIDQSKKIEFVGKKIIDDLSIKIANKNELILDKIDMSKIISNTKYIVKNNSLIFPKGEYKILKDLILPNKVNLEINAGAKLFLSPNVNILLKGGFLKINGTNSEPVIIDELVKGKNWGTISVLSSEKRSKISFAKIARGGSNTKFIAQGVYYTGQLNFFNSDINVNDSLISYTKAEDAINIKKSSFKINNVEFAHNKYDAFDGDWVNGEISNSFVHNNGNDGFDFSGSRVVVKDTILENMRDKSISIGEQSNVDIINCRFSNSNYALAIKDLSQVRIFGSSIYKNNFGVAVYRKKPVFGSGFVNIFGGLIWDNLNDFATDENAKIILNNTGLNKTVISKNIKKIELRIGDINKEYKLDNYGNPIPIDKNKLSKSFIKGPITEGKDINGNPLPNLSRYNIGMIKPIQFNEKFN